jgi:hypothetical protein
MSESKSLEDLMADHIKAILDTDEPTVQELELARKYMNDHKRRSLDNAIKEIDPSAGAAQLYGITLDAPLNVNSFREDLEE